MLEKIKNLPLGYLIYGAVLLILGLCFLIFSGSPVALTVIIGLLLLLLGGAIMAISISKLQRGRAFVLKIVFASICIAVGILTIIINDKAYASLLWISCIAIVTDGAFKLRTAASCKKYDVHGWWIAASVSLAVILSSFSIATFAPSSTIVASVWLGITFFADAASNFISAVWSSKCKTAEKAELYYEVYRDIKNSPKEQ